LNDCVARDLARLGPASGGDRLEDWSAGDRFSRSVMTVVAVEALMMWMHFRPDRAPTAAENGPFDKFVRVLCEMATGKPQYVRGWVRSVVKEYAQPIAARYSKSVRG
jgi:hypothetical protein